MRRLKWKDSDQFDSEYGTNLSKLTDVHRHIILVQHNIVYVLMLNPNGLRMIELAKMVGVYRKNLSTHLKKLIENGYVKRKSGFRGRYFLTDKVFKNPLLSSTLMAESFASEILSKPDLILTDLRANPKTIDFKSSLPHFYEEEFGLSRVLFELATKIGAYIIYVLIQAMNPANEHIKEAKYLKKDDIIYETVRFSIIPLIPHLLDKFKDVIRMELRSLKSDDEDPSGPSIDYGWTIPQFQLRQDTFDELVSAYSLLYPSIYSELEKIRASLPQVILAHNYHKEYIRMQEEFQKTCKHTYVTQVYRLSNLKGEKLGLNLYLREVTQLFIASNVTTQIIKNM